MNTMTNPGQGVAGLAPDDRPFAHLSDVALKGKIRRLLFTSNLPPAQDKELDALQAERRRRREQRRGKEAIQ